VSLLVAVRFEALFERASKASTTLSSDKVQVKQRGLYVAV